MESSEPRPGGLSAQGCLGQAGLGIPPEVLLGSAASSPCSPSSRSSSPPLPLQPPSSFHKGTKALAPPRMDSEARSGVSRQLFGLPGRPIGRGVLGDPHHKWLCTWSYLTCF